MDVELIERFISDCSATMRGADRAAYVESGRHLTDEGHLRFCYFVGNDKLKASATEYLAAQAALQLLGDLDDRDD